MLEQLALAVPLAALAASAIGYGWHEVKAASVRFEDRRNRISIAREGLQSEFRERLESLLRGAIASVTEGKQLVETAVLHTTIELAAHGEDGAKIRDISSLSERAAKLDRLSTRVREAEKEFGWNLVQAGGLLVSTSILTSLPEALWRNTTYQGGLIVLSVFVGIALVSILTKVVTSIRMAKRALNDLDTVLDRAHTPP